MRKFIRQIHLYLGILVSPYLIIYGLSSFEYNHRAWFERDLGPESTVVKSFDIEAALSNAPQYHDPVIPPYIGNPQPTFVEDRALAQAARDELDLYGWIIGWEMRRESETELNFNMERPGRKYSVELDEAAGQATITGRGKGFWSVILSLHGLYDLPNSPFVSTWGIYTEITNWVVFFFIISGVYLWLAGSTDRKMGMISVVLGISLSLFIIFYAWIGG